VSAGSSSSSYGSARFAGRLRESPDAHGSCKGPNSHARYGYEPGVGLLPTDEWLQGASSAWSADSHRQAGGGTAGRLFGDGEIERERWVRAVGGPLLRFGSEP
jgi:hypothetical protein